MGPVLETDAGRVRGVREHGLVVFRGVPFAAPPLGDLRFAAPRPPRPWPGVRDASRRGAPAPQRPGELTRLLGLTGEEAREDCLTLEITTPSLEGRRPVMVWLHGGGFVTGAGSLPVYDGVHLARRGDVVLVSANYRLGALGFLPLLDAAGRPAVAAGEPFANFGLLDQLAALAWVRDHAERLGGDPGRVTVFGESAGAMAIGALLGAPRARGLFRGAILQSGAADHVHDLGAATRVARGFAEEAGVRAGDLAALRRLPAEAVVDAQVRTVARLWREVRGVTFQPVVDGDLLPEPPLAGVAAGSARGVALLLGTNRDENRLWSAFDPGVASLDAERLLRRCRVNLPGSRGGAPRAERVVEAYRALLGPGAAPAELWSEIETDRLFRAPALRLARAQAAHHEATFLYHFRFASPALEGRLGSCHALEIPFVFGTFALEGLAPLTGAGPDVEHLARSIQDRWLAFATRGDPSHPEHGPWPAFAPPRWATQVLDTVCGVEDAPFGAREPLWDDLLAP